MVEAERVIVRRFLGAGGGFGFFVIVRWVLVWLEFVLFFVTYW